MSFAKPALLGPEKVSVGSNARELWGRNEPYSGMPPVRSIWSAPRGSPGMQNSVVPDAQRTLASCGPSASSVRSGGILAGASTCLNKNHRSGQPDIQELPLRTTPRVPRRREHQENSIDLCQRQLIEIRTLRDSLRTQQDWKLEQQLSIPSLVCCSCSAVETHPPKKKSPGEPGPVSLGDST